MFELTINGTVYQFNFGIGFVRDINKRIQKPVEGVTGVKEDVGLAFTVAKILDGDVIAVVDALEAANKRYSPRITRDILEGYIDDESTDIDELFNKVMDFLERANATGRLTKKLTEAMKQENKA